MENGDVVVNNPTFRKHNCDINNDNQYCEVTSSSTFGEEKVWTGLYRPRGTLARALYYKQLSDRRLSEFDKNQWYDCKLFSMPLDLVQLFHRLHADEDTLAFLDHSVQQSDWIFTQLWHAFAKLFLGIFMTQTSINGFLGRGSMFVISSDQFRTLLDVPESWTGDSLLDLGAGNGAITAKFAPIFKQVYVTEMSHQMKNALNKQGFKVLDVDNWSQLNKYNIITCLNVLDRCDRPLEMLLQIRDSLTPNGKALIALVLPFKPYVETGPADHKPAEELDIEGESFEQQVVSFNNNVLSKIGFELIKWSKVPYLCEGDLNQAYYYLDDALFVIRRKSPES